MIRAHADCLVHQRRDDLAALLGQDPQLLSGQLLLRLLQALAELQQPLHVLGTLPNERIRQPGADRRPLELLYGSGQLLVAVPAGLDGAGVPGGDELPRLEPVEAGCDGVEVHAVLLTRKGPSGVVAGGGHEYGRPGRVSLRHGTVYLVGFGQLRAGQHPGEGVLGGSGAQRPFPPDREPERVAHPLREGGREDGQALDSDQIELGYEVDKGKLVVVDPAEVDELRPRTTRTIDITDFVELAEVDPVYYNRTYWLVPDGEAASRAYRLLLAAMENRGRVGIGMVVMRNKQYLAAIRPRDHALALSTMRFADEVVSRSDFDGLPSKSAKPDAKELKLANQIIDSLSAPWKPDQYHDTYTEEVRELIKAHEKGKEVVVEEAPAARAEMSDLMAALDASLKAARSRGGIESALEKMAEQRSADDGADEDDEAGQAPKNKRSGAKTPTSRSKKAPAKKGQGKRGSPSKRSPGRSRSSKNPTDRSRPAA